MRIAWGLGRVRVRGEPGSKSRDRLSGLAFLRSELRFENNVDEKGERTVGKR
jgi:hypothetical protein